MIKHKRWFVRIVLISIIIPVYNKEKYLDKCIKSAVNQDYKNIEIIIINDGSEDNSEQIISKWLKKDYRIKYLNQENKGVSYTRNRGLLSANGDYIFFLDADDYLEKNAISVLVDYIKKSNVDIIIGNFYEKTGEKIIKLPSFENRLFTYKELKLTDTILEMFLINGRHMAKAGNKLYKTSFIKDNQIKFENGVIAEDRLFNLLCYVNKPIIQIVNEYTYVYNKIDNSRSRTIDTNFYEESIALVKKFFEYLLKTSKLEEYYHLFQYVVIYDVYKIVDRTFKGANKKYSMTKFVIHKLRNEKFIIDTLINVLNLRNFSNFKKEKHLFRMSIQSYLIIKAPILIMIYKTLSRVMKGN